MLKKDVVKGWVAVADAEVPFQQKDMEKSQAQVNKTVYYTEHDLTMTKSGRDGMMALLDAMRVDYESFHSLIVKDGKLMLPGFAPSEWPLWKEVQLRLPGYFAQRYQKGTSFYKKLGAEDKARSFGMLVLRELQSKAPRPENKAGFGVASECTQ